MWGSISFLEGGEKAGFDLSIGRVLFFFFFILVPLVYSVFCLGLGKDRRAGTVCSCDYVGCIGDAMNGMAAIYDYISGFTG